MNVSRRGFVASAGSLLLAQSARAEPAKPSRIVFNDSGGSMTSNLRRIYFNEFEKRTGIQIVQTSPVDFAKLRAMVDAGSPEWTVTEIGSQDSIRAIKMGLVEPLDPAIIDRSAFPPQAQNPNVFASSVYSTVLAYDADEFTHRSAIKATFFLYSIGIGVMRG